MRFQAQSGDQDRSGNAPAGTTVDDVIGDLHVFDFFCQSQGGLKGTSRPCRYIVLKDESNFSADKLQILINSGKKNLYLSCRIKDVFSIVFSPVCLSYQPATRSVEMAASAYVRSFANFFSSMP